MTRQKEINCKNRKYKEIVNEMLFLKNITGQEEFILLEAGNITEEKIKQMLMEKGINRIFVSKKDLDSYTIEFY